MLKVGGRCRHGDLAPIRVGNQRTQTLGLGLDPAPRLDADAASDTCADRRAQHRVGQRDALGDFDPQGLHADTLPVGGTKMAGSGLA